MRNKTQDFNINIIKAIIGLGNPGEKYYRHRHSIGFRIADHLVEKYGGNWREDANLLFSQIYLNGELNKHLYVIKPTTYMNNSGKSISFLIRKGIKPEETLVLHDDIELSFGKIRIRFDGSSRGHNGLRSIESVWGLNFWRLRFGVDRPSSKEEVPNYVLSPFPNEEENKIDSLIDKAIQLILGS